MKKWLVVLIFLILAITSIFVGVNEVTVSGLMEGKSHAMVTSSQNPHTTNDQFDFSRGNVKYFWSYYAAFYAK